MIHISASEWIIMKELWNKSPMTSREIIDSIDDFTDWNSKTVHTLISRLCKKGAVHAVRDDGAYTYRYYANINEEECIKEETRSFLDRIYEGSIKNMISAFVKHNEISPSEINELRELLDSLGKDEKE